MSTNIASTMSSRILPRVFAPLNVEVFDPANSLHLEAFEMLAYKGRQHPTLRFHLEYPYLDVRAMMHDKVGRAYLELRRIS